MAKKLTYEYVYNYFKEQNCELLETEYINTKLKMKYTCTCGNISEMNFNNFKNNHRCLQCGYSERNLYNKLNHDDVLNYYNNKGYTMKSIYKNSKYKDNIICPEGHEIKIRFNDFQQGHKCVVCFHSKNTGDNHPNWKNDRTRYTRTSYLSFDLDKSNILTDDINYKDYLLNKQNYNIDHIYPRIAFIDNDFDKIYDKYLIKKICNLRENLRIITCKENRLKSRKYNQEEFIKWFNKNIIILKKEIINE